MSNYLRKNAWNNQGTFENSDLLWYAKGVGVMQSRKLDDKSSWWFFAAIHGEYIEKRHSNDYLSWGDIPGVPAVPVTPMPSLNVRYKYWNQCQHQTWYFAPWHRGYVIALEEHIRKAIIDLGGPSDWALPYWNYLGPDNQYKIPPAFTVQKLPDGSPNPLYVTARYGPLHNGKDICVPKDSINDACQNSQQYTTTSQSNEGYGGSKTTFSHGGNFAFTGIIENNPHNTVHVKVGGADRTQPNTDANEGLMSDPDIAALDPIFYLHHCNIDRLWASWNTVYSNPTDPDWLDGPSSVVGREFVMPKLDGSAWVFTPAEMNSLDLLNYDYDDLKTNAPEQTNQLALRLQRLGVEGVNQNEVLTTSSKSNQITELVGASQTGLQLDAKGLQTSIKLDSKSWKSIPNSFRKVSKTSIPDQVFLQLENVRGNLNANMLQVAVNDQPVGKVALFGLRSASQQDSHHGGSGLTFIFNITDVIDKLHLENSLDINQLNVKVSTEHHLNDQKITVGRMSVYREQH